MNPHLRKILFAFIGAIPLGAAVAALSPGNFWSGWLAAGLLSWFGLYLLILVWNWTGREKIVAWMIALAFILRLGVGISLSLGLPVYGYDQKVQKEGYLFRDAQNRDQMAWEMAQPGHNLWPSLNKEIGTDQYGGLLSLSAVIYRFLSPDAHRPFLVLILGAMATAAGLPFLWKAFCKRWNRSIANLTVWMVALYPDGILFGASQMREPFLIGLSCIAFWAIITWAESRRRSTVVFITSMVLMALFSSRFAIAFTGFIAIWFFLDYFLTRQFHQKWMLWLGVVAALLALALMSAGWLIESSQWDMSVSESNSGWLHKIILEAGEQYRAPIIVVYGLVQPVLPATIADPAPWIWKVVSIPRATGWYALAPFLFYGIFNFWKAKKIEDRRILAWLAGFVVLWLIVSSARAGGDQWDNPRYRSLLLPAMALFASWGINYALETRDLWLVRWLAVEVVFLGFFTQWYFSRYFQVWGRMYFWQTVTWIVGLSALILASGWLWDLGKWILAKRRR